MGKPHDRRILEIAAARVLPKGEAWPPHIFYAINYFLPQEGRFFSTPTFGLDIRSALHIVLSYL
jgi:hypothetical protein